MLVEKLDPKFKRPIKKTLLIDGKEISVRYAPSRVITQIEQNSSKRNNIVSFDDLPSSDFDEAILYGEEYHERLGIKGEFKSPPPKQKEILSNLLKAIALFTMEEVLIDAIATIPRKKDGNFAMNRNSKVWQMEGLYRNLEYYAIKGKSTSPDSVEFTVTNAKASAFLSPSDGFPKLIDQYPHLVCELFPEKATTAKAKKPPKQT